MDTGREEGGEMDEKTGSGPLPLVVVAGVTTAGAPGVRGRGAHATSFSSVRRSWRDMASWLVSSSTCLAACAQPTSSSCTWFLQCVDSRDAASMSTRILNCERSK